MINGIFHCCKKTRMITPRIKNLKRTWGAGAGVQHVEEVGCVGQALVGRGSVAPRALVVRQSRQGRHLRYENSEKLYHSALSQGLASGSYCKLSHIAQRQTGHAHALQP